MKTYNEVVDEVEKTLVDCNDPIEMPLKHYFTDGMYCREIFIPAGTVLTSKIHNTQHPYVISKGRIQVIKEDNGLEELEAPYFGITMPNTRRILYALEDTVWTTFHATNIRPTDNSEEAIKIAVDKIENRIIRKRDNKLLKSRKEITQ